MKRLLILVIFVSIILAGLSSCSSTAQETRESIKIGGGYPESFSDGTAQLEYMRDFTKTEVQWVPAPLENPLDKLMLELGSKEDYNMVSVNYAEIDQKLALDLRDYASYAPNLVAGITPEDWKVCTDPKTGAVYCIPSMQGASHIINTTIYRKDILEKEGIEVPKTTDEFLKTTCNLADKGYKRPWAVNWESAIYDYGIRQAYGVGWDFNYDENNKLVYTGMDQRFCDFLDWAKKMYDCGGYGVDYETITQEERDASFVNGESVFMTSPWWEAKAQEEGLKTNGVEYSDVVAALDLTGPNNNKMHEQEGPGCFNYLFIPVYMEKYAVESPEFLNTTYEEEYIMQTRYGFEGESYTLNEEGVAEQILL